MAPASGLTGAGRAGDALPASTYRLIVSVGSTIGLAIMGDSLLYNVLPLEADRLGLAAGLVGVLLSANRIVRLASNSGLSWLYERLGPRLPFASAALLALVTTATYGVGRGLAVLLAARILWGIAWSALRQGGFQAVWAGDEAAHGRLTGLLWSLVRVGSAAGVFLGGALYDRWGYQTALVTVACLTVMAFPVALSCRWSGVGHGHFRRPELTGWRTALQGGRPRWLLAAGFLQNGLDGVLMSTVSLFLLARQGAGLAGVGMASGALLAVRWLSGAIIGPVLGALSDRLGQSRTALLLAGIVTASLAVALVLPGWWAGLPLGLAFAAGAGLFIALSAAANTVALQTERPHLFVGVFVTAADAGLAVGPLVAYSLGSRLGLPTLYLAAGGLLLMAVLFYRRWECNPDPRSNE